jgi:hypothetical protein
MNTYNLTNSDKIQEEHIIRQILHNNGYKHTGPLDTKKTIKPKPQQNNNKWAKFTYTGKETRFITKILKDSPIKIAYTTSNTLSKLLSASPAHNHTHDHYNNSGVYRLTCPDCGMKYVGQTGRPFRVRFQEHFRDYKYNNNKSKFATHLLENNHSIGPINDIMEIVHITTKGKIMDTIEKYHIYNETYHNNQINDKNTIKPNAIFEVLVRQPPERRHTPTLASPTQPVIHRPHNLTDLGQHSRTT